MRETVLDEMFAGFETDARALVRPPGVVAAQRRVRERRRRQRGLLAAVAAVLVGTPAGALAVTDRHEVPPPSTPTPASVSERKVVLPGAAGSLADLRFVDARHGWALVDTCTREARSGCRRTLGRTADGGATWQGRELPGSDGGAGLIPVDEQTMAVVTKKEYLVTTDGGASFASHPAKTPPEAVISLASATPSGFRLACPEKEKVGDGDCARFRLARLGADPVRQQPLLDLDRDAAPQIVEGGDGRLWLATMKDGRSTVTVTDDQANTWSELPPLTAQAVLTVSPDGADAWLVDGGRGAVWRLDGDRWQQRPGLPHTPVEGGFAAAGGGSIFVNSAGRAGFWVDGRYVDQPGLRDALARSGSGRVGVQVLRDGTIVLKGDGAWRIVGVGSGVDRTWTWFS